MSSTRHIHLVSDSTGETLNALARAALALYADIPVSLTPWVFVRSEADLDQAIAGIRAAPGLVCFTLVNPHHRARLEALCAELQLEALPALDPMIAATTRLLEQTPNLKVGQQHKVTEAYFDRIAALDFAISHDDGQDGARLSDADVILTGVSRTSKTPTCIYLAYRGIKAANLPLVAGRDSHRALEEAVATGIPVIALSASPSRLSQIRSERLQALGTRNDTADYADLERIREEVAEARLLFQRHAIPVIDVTRRSIEETAAAIQGHLRARQEAP